MKKLLFLTIVIGFGMEAFHQALVNGTFLKYLDEHPNPLVVPQIEYYVGGIYAWFHNGQEASTYFYRIPVRYPASPLADDAYWEYLRTLDDTTPGARTFLFEQCDKYFELFPKGDHTENVHMKLEAYRSGLR